MQTIVKQILQFVAGALAYFTLSRLGLDHPINHGLPPFWFSTGIAVFLVWKFGDAFLVAIAVGSLAAGLTEGLPVSAVLLFTLGNVLAPWVGAKGLDFFTKNFERMGDIGQPFGLFATASIATMIHAAFSALRLNSHQPLTLANFASSFYLWWGADFVFSVGTLACLLIVTKLWNDSETKRAFYAQLLTSTLTAGLVSLLSLMLLRAAPGSVFLCLVLPIFILAGAFLSPLAAHLTYFAITMISIVMTYSGAGPFQWGTLNENLINLLIFMGTAGISLMFMVTFAYAGHMRRGFAVMFSASIVSALVLWSLIEIQTRRDDDHTSRLIEVQSDEIRGRMRDHLNLLHASASFWQTYQSQGADITPNIWQTFAEGLAVLQGTPVSRTVGLVERVHRSNLDSYLNKQRKWLPGFQVKVYETKTPAPPSDYLYLVSTPPSHGLNPLAVGRDMATEPVRKRATELAIEKRQAIMSEPIKLFSSTRPAFAVFHPLFHNDEAKGWVDVMMTYDDFFNGVSQPQKSELGWSVRHANHPDLVLYQSHKSEELKDVPFLRKSTLELNNSDLIVSWYKMPGFSSSLTSSMIWMFVIITFVSIAMAAMTANLESIKTRAETLAEKISGDLEKHRVAIFHSSKMSSLGHMASGIAHEINNPLMIIVGLAHQIQSDIDKTVGLPADFKERQSSRLEKINATISRISAIIRGLQNFSRSGDALARKPTPVADIVGTVTDLCTEKFRHRGIDLRVQQPPALDIPVVTVQIEQVLMNLLMNSFDAVQNEKEKWIEIGYELADGFLGITVTDSGRGLPKDVAFRIMEPFFTTKPIGKGTGLGLSICKGILENHGGRLTYVPDYPYTRFKIEIPLSEVSKSATPNQPVAPIGDKPAAVAQV